MRLLLVVAVLAFGACEKDKEFEAVNAVKAPDEAVAKSNDPGVKEMPKIPDAKKPVSPAGTVRFNSPAEFGAKGPLRWSAPEGWTGIKPASSMRLAEYTVPGGEGKEPSTMTVFYFGRGQGGDVEMNINRWVGQFTTEAGESAKDQAKRDKKTVDGMAVHLVDVSGTFNAGMAGGNLPPKPNQRMMAAIVESDAGRFFFKLVGPIDGVSAQETNFNTFVESLKKGS